jgi:SpoVK/Ycf46/Vps4 family AAA+-type ATPase
MMAPEDFSSYFNDLFQDAELLNALVCLKDASTILAEARYVALFTRQLALHPIVCALCVDLPVTVSPELDPYVTFKTKMDANLKENAVSYWKPHLSLPFVNNLHVDVLDLSRKLALQPFQIQKAARLAYYATSAEDEAADSMDLAANESDIFLSNQSLERAASAQITKNIGNLAFITDPEVTLNDVIVSDDIMKKIKQIIGSAQNRRRVLYDWGLSKRIRRGTGVICLFDGEPGTGKTHSAEAIAKCLGLSLMRVNIASMVDKYIGETEKNLTKIFEQARPDMSLLLFDEADSLFTKRTSNVSKSNDRYSNMSVNVLLQLVERYEGVSVLTTNLKNSIDPAFERRITYKIYFPMPKKEERIRLWKYMCPPDVLTSEPLDYEWLGEIEMSGGEIKNAVLAGAFKAATMGKLLDTEVLYDAGVTEASAAGRVMRHYDEDDDGFN